MQTATNTKTAPTACVVCKLSWDNPLACSCVYCGADWRMEEGFLIVHRENVFVLQDEDDKTKFHRFTQISPQHGCKRDGVLFSSHCIECGPQTNSLFTEADRLQFGCCVTCQKPFESVTAGNSGTSLSAFAQDFFNTGGDVYENGDSSVLSAGCGGGAGAGKGKGKAPLYKGKGKCRPRKRPHGQREGYQMHCLRSLHGKCDHLLNGQGKGNPRYLCSAPPHDRDTGELLRKECCNKCGGPMGVRLTMIDEPKRKGKGPLYKKKKTC